MIAALYVQEGGCYYGVDGVDPWPEARDARTYAGPWPVVAHPPCERWGRYAAGGPSHHGRFVPGADGGCFAAALTSVRRWGGVLEHPAGSRAWAAYGLTAPPVAGGWVPAGDGVGQTCVVEQGWYEHQARKRTWLYAVSTAPLPALRWGPAPGDFRRGEGATERQRRRGALERLSRRQRAATPPAFRDLLLSIAGRAA